MPRKAHFSVTRLCGFTVLAIAIAALGCSSDKHVGPIVNASKLPVGTPLNSAPDSTVLRLLVAYQYLAPAEYDTLLTSDFHYHFSSQTDPTLVAFYGYSWGKADEGQSFTHLVHGFTNSQGSYIPPASNITDAVINGVIDADTTHADSTDWYKVVRVSSLNINIDLPSDVGMATYNISAPFVFRLVRGDAAALNPGQSHSATRWYVREIDDEAAPLALRKGPHTDPARPVTWGSIRSTYRS